MTGYLQMDLVLIAAVTFTCWRFRKHPRVIAIGFYLGAFFTAMALPSLAGAIAVTLRAPLGVAILSGLEIYCLGVAAYEVVTGEHHHHALTPAASMAGGVTLAGIVVGWPQIVSQFVSLPGGTGRALGKSASTAQHLARGGLITPAQAHDTLLLVIAVIAAIGLWLHRHVRQRERRALAAALAITSPDEEQRKLNAARRLAGIDPMQRHLRAQKAITGLAAVPLKEISLIRQIRGVKAVFAGHKNTFRTFRGPMPGRSAGLPPGFGGTGTPPPAVGGSRRDGR